MLGGVFDSLRVLSARRTAPDRSLHVGDILVEAWSAGTEMRGISHCGFRPTRIILDDVEDSAGVESAVRRERLREWFVEVVEHLGDAATGIDVIGTLLHPESLLAWLLKRPDFSGRIYRAITSFAGNDTLWEEWRRIMVNLDDPERMMTAKRFFLARRDEMLRGARVLWPEREDYPELMRQMTLLGRGAFYQEKQNEPRGAESGLISRDRLRWFTVEGDVLLVEKSGCDPRRTPLSGLVVAGFLDAALGGGGRGRRPGDYAAIATVGRDRAGFCYVLDVWLRRVPPSAQAVRIFELHARYRYARFGLEANCFQSLMRYPIEEERARRRDRGEPWDVCVEEVAHRDPKERRLAALEPAAANGWLLFNRALPEEFLRQLEDIPRGLHDDGPDALAGAWKILEKPGRDRDGGPEAAGLGGVAGRLRRY